MSAVSPYSAFRIRHSVFYIFRRFLYFVAKSRTVADELGAELEQGVIFGRSFHLSSHLEIFTLSKSFSVVTLPVVLSKRAGEINRV